MKKALLIGIAILTVFVARQALADKLTGSTYTVYDTINSGGDTLNGAAYTVKDSKGEMLGGKMSGSIYGITPGLFGLGVFTSTGPVTGEQVPSGTVRLYISRSGTDLKITWEAADNPTIYVLTGDGTGNFNNNASLWTKIVENGAKVSYSLNIGTFNLAPGVMTHVSQVTGGNDELYYRGLKQGVNPAAAHPVITGATYLSAAWAVGKVNLMIPKGGKALLSSPVVDLPAKDVFLPQMFLDGQSVNLFPKLGSGLDVTTIAYTNQIFSGNNFTLSPTTGFWIKNTGTSAVYFTLCGDLARKYDKDLTTKDLTGTPVCGPIPTAQLGGENSDIVYKQLGNGLTPYTKASGSWPIDLTIKMKDGFWYKTTSGSRYWEIDGLNLKAVIKSK